MMKSVSIALAAVAVCNIATVSATAQGTVKVIDNPRRVVITEDSLGSHVKVLTEDKRRCTPMTTMWATTTTTASR